MLLTKGPNSMMKEIKPESRIHKPIDELRELYRTRRDLDALINEYDPQPKIDELTTEIKALQMKRAEVKHRFEEFEDKVRPLIVQHAAVEKRLKLLQNRKKVNQLLKLAARAKA